MVINLLRFSIYFIPLLHYWPVIRYQTLKNKRVIFSHKCFFQSVFYNHEFTYIDPTVSSSSSPLPHPPSPTLPPHYPTLTPHTTSCSQKESEMSPGWQVEGGCAVGECGSCGWAEKVDQVHFVVEL